MIALLLALAQAAELTKPPALVTFVEAPFPASEAGHTGSVVLAVTIRADGTVEDAVVQTSASPDFDAAAVAAVKQFVFTPAEIDGKPSRIRILYQYDFVEKAAVPTTAIFSGVVMDREAKVPIPGVTVTLADGRSVVTDAEGRFELLDVEPGTLSVTLEGERLTALSTEETFTAGERLDTTYEVFLAEPGEEGDDMEILVVAPTIKKQAVSTEIPADEARKVPGTSGDVLRVVENLPGVARASLGTGALVVWGAAPGDTGVFIDGVPVPRLYHDGGLRSVMGSEFVKSVELVPGGYGAAYGRGLGGLVSVSTQPFDDATHGAVSADLYDASAAVHGPVKDHLTWGVGARYGYVGPLLSTFYPGVEDYFPVPHYYDGQARVGWRLGPSERLDLTAIVSSDRTERTAPNPDPAREASEEKRLDFQRVSLRYTHDVGDGSTVTALAYVGADHASQVSRYGNVDTSIVSDVRMAGARASLRTRILPFLTGEGGVDVHVPVTDVTEHGSIAVPAREGDVRVFGQAPPDQIASDTFRVVQVNVAPYAEGDLGLLQDHLHVLAGLRFDPNARSVSRAFPQEGISPTNGIYAQDPSLEPRVLARWAPSEHGYALLAWGLYSQQPVATDLSASFGNPTLPVSTGSHYVAGAGVKPGPVSVEVTGFYTQSEGLAMRSSAEQPARAEALVGEGAGRTYGAQMMARLDPTGGAYAWISYTLGWSERRDTPTSAWRPSDYDQRHVLTALGGYRLPWDLDVSARVRVATGYPRTPVVGSYYDSRRDLYQPLFGEQNTERLPTFFQADLRLARTFPIGGTTLDVSLEVQNVTNAANVEEYLWSADYSERGEIRGLPILPVLGLRWSF